MQIFLFKTPFYNSNLIKFIKSNLYPSTMKNFHLLSLVLLLLSCTNPYKDITNTKEDYSIIPQPQKLNISNGKFLFKSSTSIISSDELKNESDYLNKLIEGALGYQLTVTSKKKDSNCIELVLDASVEQLEGYKIEVTYEKIIISGKTNQGVFYGIQSLRQLMPADIENQENLINELTIPACEIEDYPKFSYRGMHLDVCRHFFPVDFIKKYLDLIALHKMNTFHWHLTEDQGWRIEIKKYPKLTEIGAFRKETMVEKNFDPYIGDGKSYGGFYTQKEIKEIVAYAKSKHITVIPEIELPGHSLAAIASYPNLGNTGEQYEVATKWGVFEEIYAPKEETFQFLEDVLTEVMELFPSKYIHIGGDEAPKNQWKESLQAQEVIKREGLKDEHELQSYFIKRIEKFLNSHGRNVIGWDEILEGGLAPNATVMSWRGTEGGIAAAKQKHNVIMTPGHSCYLDHYQTEDRENEPLAIGGKTTVEDVYNYNPLPEELSADEQKYILGAQGNVWTEYMKTTNHVEYMILPRMSALSEVVWSNSKKSSFEDFKVRLTKLRNRYDALKLNYGKHVFKVSDSIE